MNSKKLLFGSLSLVFGLFGVNVAGAIAQQEQSLQNLPDGNYVYKEVATSSSRLDTSRYFLFRKVGVSVTGYHFKPYTDWTYCFKGQLQDLSLVNITMAEPKFGRGLSGFNFTQPKPEDLRNYQQVNLSKVFSTYTKLNQSLQQCIDLLPLPSSPKISNSTPSVPTSSTPVKQANSGDGYPTDSEIQRLSQELEQILIPEMQRSRLPTDTLQPAPIFLPILQDIRDKLTISKGMNIRLPSTFPNAPNGLSGYRPEIYTDQNGYFSIIFAISSCPQPVTGMCDTGRIFAVKKGTNAETSFRQIQQQGILIDLTKQVSGYYRSYRSATRGGMEEVMWEQDGLIYGVMSRSMSKSEVISVAKSMANERPIYDPKYTTPSVPASSKPVKQTNTIAEYPTNDDFQKVDRILQASRNPESLVNLKGRQQDQRRKFQKEWESRNPAAAKFLGSWYTGGKSFYVYPSTSKGGTCVITKDNQGNLDLQIGAVLNKELRYGGGKGFFWIDRENIIASRDSNSGDLYPIYATSEVPELSESTISDMQSQKCITTLPTAPVATKPLPKNTSGQLLSNENVACTTEFKTLLGQTASAYCKSSQVDSGIIFDDIKVTKNADRSVKLELRMFNRGSAEGFVEVYDSNKKLQDIKIIDGNRPPTGLLQSGGELFTKVPASLFSRYPLGDDRRNLQEQILDVTIPAGGYVQITKSSNFAVRYNTAMLLLEIYKLGQGDPGFTKQASMRKFLVGFAKESSGEAGINIFKGEVNIQSIASMEFVDKNKLAEVFQRLVEYSVSIEKDPSKNPIFSAFSDVTLTTGNTGLERALDVIVPGLGTLSGNVTTAGDGLNIAARAIDIENSIAADRKATIIFRNPL